MHRNPGRGFLAVGLAAMFVAACSTSLPVPPTSAPSMLQATSTPSVTVAPETRAPDPAPVAPPKGALRPTPIASPSVAPAVTGRPSPKPAATARTVVLHVPILMYHRIVDAVVARCGIPGLCVSPAVFSAQLEGLAAAGWRTITMATLAAHLAKGTIPPPRTFVITIDDGYRDGFTNALPVLTRLGFVATYYVSPGRFGGSFLESNDVVALAAAGMEIGDHTVSHANLTRLSAADVAFQIGTAAKTIESIIGRAPTTFAYPFGNRSPAVVAAVAAAGFGAAVINRNDGLETWQNRFQLPRSEVGPHVTAQELLRRVASY